MTVLSLRFRIFLFFCLLACGGSVIVLLAAWLGYRQLDDPEALSALTTIVIASAFGLFGLSTFVWLLFDENLGKPIEQLAARFRLHADAGIQSEADGDLGRYLGDLAPAAMTLQRKLGDVSTATEDIVAQRTAHLERQRKHLLQILSDVPAATILVTGDHQIALYDGQAADLMEREAPARLFSSVFDYLDEDEIRRVLAGMEADGVSRRPVALKGKTGSVYSGSLRLLGGAAGYTLMLEPLDPDAARPLVYDFDLLDKPVSCAPAEMKLRDLTFVVFDSETTGLNPDQDHVVQIGAVRVVNGKIVPGERFDRLVNPGRAIPPSSTRVHNVTDEMVADSPPFAKVCLDFQTFCQGAVLVAHNAPFDMAFLRREEGQAVRRFDNLILDTVHLSAIVFGASQTHTLDALCQRLGIEIDPMLRHTAIGDALSTAEALVALLPVLEGRGLDTFGAVQTEARKHSRLLNVE